MFDWWIGFAFIRSAGILFAIAFLLAIGYVALRAYLSASITIELVGIVTLCALGIAICVYPVYRYRTRLRMRMRTLGELLVLTPREFEYAVADLLHDLDYRDIRLVGQTGDLAADITCRDRKGRSIVVQCKRYAPGARIGSPDIQTFIGMITVHHGADRGLFVTTSLFSKPAIDLAQRHGIQLIDGPTIARMLSTMN